MISDSLSHQQKNGSSAFKIEQYNRTFCINYLATSQRMKSDDHDPFPFPSKYSRAFRSYSRSEIKAVTPILRSVAHSCHIALRFPVYKVLKAVAKIFLLNEIEAIFFAYLIKETNWDIKDRLITQNSELVRDVVCISSDQPVYKNLILYLVLVTYSLKYFLNDQSEELLEQATRICPGFKPIFENWAKKNSNLMKRINPKTLNKVYQDLYLRIRHEEIDYNLLVDSTLQISPAYNPQKTEKDGRKTERKEEGGAAGPGRIQKSVVKVEHVVGVKVQAGSHLDHNPLFSSSRLYEMAQVGNCVSEVSRFQVFGQMNKSLNMGTKLCNSILGSSDLLPPLYPLQDKEFYCEQLNLGLQQGLSEQNLNLAPQMPANPINLSRVNSITSRYFSLNQ